MSAEDDENEPVRVEKLYCCGNSSQKEALYISRFDFACAVFSLLCNVSFAVIVAAYPSQIQKLPASSILIALHDFLNGLDPIWKWTILIAQPVYDLFRIFVAVILAYGAQQRNITWLIWWFILTILLTIIDETIAVLLATILPTLAVVITVSVCIFLYNWYALWICWVLIRRTRAIRNGFDFPSDDEAQAVQMEPSPVPLPYSLHQHQEDKL